MDYHSLWLSAARHAGKIDEWARCKATLRTLYCNIMGAAREKLCKHF